MVTDDAGLTELREGKATFLVPPGYNRKGPGKKSGGVFYNRQMEFNRDVCISLLRAQNRRLSILDAMAATGVRSLRMALELEQKQEIVANDSSPSAAALIRENAERLGIENIVVTNSRAEAAMSERGYDYIDIDPFGTPIRFAAIAVSAVKSGGILGITATDSAVLCGSAKGSRRRYYAASKRWPFMHELGVRILVGYLVRTGASYDRAVYPVLSFFADHYFRTYVRVVNGVGRAEKQLEQIGYAGYDGRTAERWIGKVSSAEAAGPMWTGPLHDLSTVKAMKTEEWFGSSARVEKMLALWAAEAEAPPLFYDADELSSRFGFNLPPMDETVRIVGERFSACRTHFSPKGLKTDATAGELREILSAAARGKGISE